MILLLQVRGWAPVGPHCVYPAALWDLGPGRERPWLHSWSAHAPGSCSWGACRGECRGGGRCQGSLWAATLSTCRVGGPRCLSRQLLQHECPQCPELPPFGLFGDLEQHMRKQHELFCCKLCLKHLKVRPAESRARDLGPWVFVCPPPALLSHTGQAGRCSWCVCGGRGRGETEAALLSWGRGKGLTRAQHPLPYRYSRTSANGTRARTSRGTACRGTLTTRHTAGTRSASSVTSATWTTTSCSNTCAATTISVTFVTRTGPRTTTGGRGPRVPEQAGQGRRPGWQGPAGSC